MAKKLSIAKLTALAIAHIEGAVVIGDDQRIAKGGLAGRVSANTITALMDAGLLRPTRDGLARELTKEGLSALGYGGIISAEEYTETRRKWDEWMAVAHAEAVEMDERRTIARAFLSTPVGVVLTDAEIEEGVRGSEAATEALLVANTRKNSESTVVNVLPDGSTVVDLVADELGPIEETDGRCAYGNIHAIETCFGCNTEDENGNQITPRGTVEIHTAGELHAAPEMPVPDFTYNLSRLLDDPAHRPGAELIELDGTDGRVQEFVFATEGANDLYRDMVRDIERQLERGKNVVVLVLCRGGKHRSVAFGEDLATHFEVAAKHHHRHLPRVLDGGSRVPNTVQAWAAYAAKLKASRDAAEAKVAELLVHTPKRVHILPGQDVHQNNVYTITDKGYTSGNGLFWEFSHKLQAPCVRTGIHAGADCIEDWRQGR